MAINKSGAETLRMSSFGLWAKFHHELFIGVDGRHPRHGMFGIDLDHDGLFAAVRNVRYTSRFACP